MSPPPHTDRRSLKGPHENHNGTVHLTSNQCNKVFTKYVSPVLVTSRLKQTVISGEFQF